MSISPQESRSAPRSSLIIGPNELPVGPTVQRRRFADRDVSGLQGEANAMLNSDADVKKKEVMR